MRLRQAILLTIASMLALGATVAMYEVKEEIKPRYREGIEVSLVDIAHILAKLVSSGPAQTQAVKDAFTNIDSIKVDAVIYKFRKQHVDMHLYLTDAKGKVIFHSKHPEEIGKDYSNWREVKLTLQGKYGARTTREDLNDPRSTVLYVSAPLITDGRISGVLTLMKPQWEVHYFIQRLQDRIFAESIAGALLFLFVGMGLSKLISKPLSELKEYARLVEQGKATAVPASQIVEVASVASAIDGMRRALEGKQYIEEYVQTLTHELKSPTTAIQASGEILVGDVIETKDRKRFAETIVRESKRIEEILNKLLQMASLESGNIFKPKACSLAQIMEDACQKVSPLLERKPVVINNDVSDVTIMGDPFLLSQCFENILKNAIDFSEVGGTITISSQPLGDKIKIEVDDEGSGIPEFAIERIGERFYSLPRPDTGKKGHGLGLLFCKRVAELHGGSITISINKPRGTKVTVSI